MKSRCSTVLGDADQSWILAYDSGESFQAALVTAARTNPSKLRATNVILGLMAIRWTGRHFYRRSIDLIITGVCAAPVRSSGFNARLQMWPSFHEK